MSILTKKQDKQTKRVHRKVTTSSSLVEVKVEFGVEVGVEVEVTGKVGKLSFSTRFILLRMVGVGGRRNEY